MDCNPLLKKIISCTQLCSACLLVTSSVAWGAVYYMPSHGNDIIGHTVTVQIKKGDTINKFMQKYEVSYHELLEANPRIKPRNLRIGAPFLIPTEYILPKYRTGIVINIPELRLYYFTTDGQYVFTTPVGLGRYGWRTPSVASKVVDKEENPTWHVPKSIAEHAYKTKGKILPEEIPPGPDNPLGKYAIYLAYSGYLIHGTNDSDSVGKYYSSGCMRLYDEAIKTLYEVINIGAPVHIIHHVNKVGWLNDKLYLESHMPVSHDEENSELNHYDIETAISEATSYRAARIDWDAADIVEKEQLGIPKPIGETLHHGDFGISINK